MACDNCGGEIAETANFCRHCGAAQSADELSESGEAAPPAQEGTDTGETTEQLQAAIASLQAQVGHLTARVASLESEQSSRPVAVSGAAPRAAATTPQPPQSSSAAQAAAAPIPPPVSPPAAPPGGGEVVAGAPSGGESSWSWEWLVGGNWLARIGILALIIGVGFFLKLAFDNQWIGETGRVVLGLVTGLALLGGGEYWTRKYPVWAQAVTGGGLAILYLSIFAAFSLYELIPAWAALGFSFLVTLAAAGLALRYEARAIAVLGILGGFATPLFLADKLPQQWALLGYVLVLDVGVLALATFRNWRWFTLLALVGSIILFFFWEEELDPPLALAQVGISVIFLIFVGATTLFHLIWRRPPQAFDQVLITLNAAAYLGISYGLLWSDFRVWMGGFTLALALFYGLLGYGILMRHREQVHLSLFAVGVALVLLSIAVPVQLDGLWIAPAWAVEGAALVWLSFFTRMPQLRLFGVAAFVVALGWLLISEVPFEFGFDYYYDPYSGSDEHWPFLNLRLLSHAMIIAATCVAAFLWWRGREDYAYDGEVLAPVIFLATANILTLWALSVQVIDAFYIAADNNLVSGHIVNNAISLSLSGLWALYAAILIVLGIVRRDRWLRLGGLALLAIPILKLFLYDAFQLDQGFRVAAFIGLGALLVVGGFLYQRYSRVIRGFLLE